MDFAFISDKELDIKIVELCKIERMALVDLLYHLIEFDRRRAYLALGYSSLFSYCRSKLQLSEGGTFRRISACRALRDNPEIAQLLVEGKLTLCSVAAAATALKERATEVKAIIGKSKSEVLQMVAPKVETRPKEVIRPLTVRAPSVPLLNEQPMEQRCEIKFTVTKEVFDKFNQARSRLSNSLGADSSFESAFTKLLDHYLTPRERKVLKLSSNGRYIPRSLKRKVFEQNHGRCCFVSKEGIGCTESKFIQIDHILPFAKGGKTELSNLRLLCSAHNKHEAENEFGYDFIQGKINSQLEIR